MSEIRVSDPSKLHLRKELTQIRKAARALRDPGTTSSWKSPLSSSRSIAAASASAWRNNVNSDSKSFNGNSQLDSHFTLPKSKNSSNGKEKRVFLYNWKNYKSSSEKSGTAKHNEDDGDQEDDEDDEDAAVNEGSSSLLESYEDSVSDACNGWDSRSDTYLGGRSHSSILRCRDTNLVTLGTSSARRAVWIKKKGKKTNSHLDFLAKYQQRETKKGRKFVNSKTLIKGHPSIAYSRDDSVEPSDDTEDYVNGEDLRRITGAPLFLRKIKQKSWSRSSKLLRNRQNEESSYSYSTPALSTSSYNRYSHQNPSTVGSWDGTTASMNDGDEVDGHLDLPGRQGCGIPCYWSKRTPKHRGMCGSCYSPSLSDTLRRKGSSILCGSRTIYPSHRRSLSCRTKQRISSRSVQGVLPLLTNSDIRGGSSIGTGRSDDELSTYFGELELEGASRLDGRRRSLSSKSQEGMEIVALNREGDEGSTPENSKSFSQKYRPMFFSELIGQNIVVQSLINAVSRGRIAPVYLFQGPRGTGKTSTARIFSAALNCLAPGESKPCGCCRECIDFIKGKSRDLLEVEGNNKKGIDIVRHLLKRLSVHSSSDNSQYMVFVIDECHLLPSKTWLAFLKFLEDPPQRVVFIFITTDHDNVPRTIQSRCQKYLFNKIKDGDIVSRLKKISAEEKLDVETDALNLIAMNADGSLRDAETILEQLSLLGKKITASLVNELVGVVSDEKLLELLELAMSSETAETVKRARELINSGVDPMVLMTQLASLIMDIIAGSYTVIDAKPGDSFFGGRSLNESELERLKHALKLLSEAEKQLRTSSERATWFTATLLQLGSMPSPDLTQSGSSRRQSSKTTEDDPSTASREFTVGKLKSDFHSMPQKSIPLSKPNHQRDALAKVDGFSKLSNSPVIDEGATHVSRDDLLENVMIRCIDSRKLNDIWAHCIEKCHSKTLKQLLENHGKLVCLCEVEGVMVAYVAFDDGDIKLRAERFLSSITNSMEIVLRCNVEVRIIHLPDFEGENPVNLLGLNKAESTTSSEMEQRADHANGAEAYSNLPPLLGKNFHPISESSDLPTEGDDERERRRDIPMRRIESIIHEQRLETAWLRAVEKGSPGTLSRLRPEKNQILPQEGIYCKDQMDSMDSARFCSQHWEDELNNEVNVLKVNNGRVLQKDQVGRRVDRCPVSPSLLHSNSIATISGKDNLEFEPSSGAGGCSGFFCWNNYRRGTVKVKVTPMKARKAGRFSLFGGCKKTKIKDSKR